MNVTILSGTMVVGLVFVAGESFAATAPAGTTPKAKKLASNGDPYAGEYRNGPLVGSGVDLLAKAPSPYANLVDQNDMDMVGAKLIRAVKPQFGIGFGSISINESKKFDVGKDKSTTTGTPLEFYGVYPTPIGLRVGFDYLQSDLKAKGSVYPSTDVTVKLTSERMAITVGGALANGFGGALVISTSKESTSGSFGSLSIKEQDATWGEIVPELYYAANEFEALFKWKPTLRHETIDRVGSYEFDLEYGTSEIHPIGKVVRSRGSEKEDDREVDSFTLNGGIRYILDRESNIRILLIAEEASYSAREYSTPTNNAGFGLRVAGEHVLQAQHVLGYGLLYELWSGKGKRSKTDSTSTTLTADGMMLNLSYKYVMR